MRRENSINILIVEDDSLTMEMTKRILRPFGNIFTADSEGEAYNIIQTEKIDLAFFDLNLHGELSGLKLITFAKIHNIYSIVLSSETQHGVLEEAFTNGAKDYLNKPFNDEKLKVVMDRFFNNRNHVEFENIINKNFITKSSELTDELYKIKNLSASNKPVFISGETGTGKRVVSHLIKDILKIENFLEINCSQFTDELFASELFGHVKGAFTGATENKIGLLEKADNGIIFLDEIHALSIKSQKTLLKALEEKEFYPVGSNKRVSSNFRVVSATCENIEELIDMGNFREDLYARINTFSINIPPIRNRKDDIMLLIQHYISKQLFQIVITKEAEEFLINYSWPRNTREINDLVENWVVHGHRLISPDILPTHIKTNIVKSSSIITENILDLACEMGLKEFMNVFKKEIILEMVKRNRGNIAKACKELNADPSNSRKFISQYKDKSLFNRRF